MGADDLLADLDLGRGEEVEVIRELDNDGTGEPRKVAGGGVLSLLRQAVHVDEMGASHAEVLRRLIHLGDEGFLTAGHGLGEHHRDVVGRSDDQHLEPNVEGDRFSLLQPEFARGLLCRQLGADEAGYRV